MDKTNIVERLQKEVECPICLERFKDPRVLPCLHTFCYECLVGLASRYKTEGKWPCPQCKMVVQVSPAEVSSLKVNFLMNTLLSVVTNGSKSAKPHCQMCTSQDHAKGGCTDCGELVCEACIASHKRMRATQHHHIASLDEVLNGGFIIKQPLYCLKHKGEVIKLFCDTCDCLICKDCLIVDHKGHDYNFTDFVADREKKIIKAMRKVELKKHSMNEVVDQFIDKQITVLQNLRIRLKTEIQLVFQKDSNQLTAKEIDLTARIEHVCGGVD
ncbi:predicted protein, partial [Nematostella vectensis]